MRNRTPQIAAFKRALAMLEAVVADAGHNNVSELARALRMPIATAHRQVATLVGEGYLKPFGRGRHVAGARLLGLLRYVDENQVITSVAQPVLERLARRMPGVVHLGTLDSGMVTYRIKCGAHAAGFFTRIGMQLEAYCSGIGKVLVANLPDAERKDYLKTGPFVPLTEHTIVDPRRLAKELDQVRKQGFAIDNEEVAEGLVCIAVPIQKPDGSTPAAISLSRITPYPQRSVLKANLDRLRKAAAKIEADVFG